MKFANDEGVVRRQLMSVSQLIPVYVQRCFAQHYYQRKVMTAEELLNALKQHAGYSTAGGQMVREKQPQNSPGGKNAARRWYCQSSCYACQLGSRKILLRESGSRRFITG